MNRIYIESKQEIHKSRVADPHHTNADTDPNQAFRLNADTVRIQLFDLMRIRTHLRFNADPDPGPQQ